MSRIEIPTKKAGATIYMVKDRYYIMMHDGADFVCIYPDQIDQVIKALTELKKEIEG